MSKTIQEQIKDAQRYIDFLRHVNGPFSEEETKRFRKQFDDSTRLSIPLPC